MSNGQAHSHLSGAGRRGPVSETITREDGTQVTRITRVDGSVVYGEVYVEDEYSRRSGSILDDANFSQYMDNKFVTAYNMFADRWNGTADIIIRQYAAISARRDRAGALSARFASITNKYNALDNVRRRGDFIDALVAQRDDVRQGEMAALSAAMLETNRRVVSGLSLSAGPIALIVGGVLTVEDAQNGNLSPADIPLALLTRGKSLRMQRVERVVDDTRRIGPHDLGPLSDDVARTFRSGSYDVVKLKQDTILYRVYGGRAREISSYWTRTKPTGPLQSKLDSALLPEWGNSATNVASIRVPKGTIIYDGVAAPQVNGVLTLPGGGSQVFIPKVNPNWIIK